MPYAFKGIFSKAAKIDRVALPSGHVFREVAEPFEGSGIQTPDMDRSFDACSKYLKELGALSSDWSFFDYQTWAGQVDYVFAFGSRSGVMFGPIEADGNTAEEAFFQALEAFGLEAGEGTHFPPFERGFWDET
jgi:hypothetical protein